MSVKSTMLNIKTESHRTLEKQEYSRIFNIQKSAYQWRMMKIRSVEIGKTDIQLFDKMTEESNTLQKKNITTAILAEDTFKEVQGLISDNNFEIPDIIPCLSFKPDGFFVRIVANSIGYLREETWPKNNPLALCLRITSDINKITQKLSINKDNGHYLKFQMGSMYGNFLCFALDYLKHKANRECSWEYFKELNILAKYFNIQPDNTATKSTNHDTLKNLYFQFIQNEFDYLEYWKFEFPSNSTKHAFIILKTLLKNSFVHRFLSTEDIETFMTKMKLLEDIIIHGQIDEVPFKRIQKFISLEKEVISKTADIKIKRRYHDMLKHELTKQTNGISFSMMPTFMYITVLNTLRHSYAKSVLYLSEFHSSTQLFNSLMIALSKKIMLEINDSSENTDHFEAESLDIIYNLLQQGLLNKECERLYDHCITKDDELSKKWTDTMYINYITHIFDLIKNNQDSSTLTAAKMLKDLLKNNGDEIKKMATADTLNKSILAAKSLMYTRIFKKILTIYYTFHLSNPPDYSFANIMKPFKDEIIKYTPYMFLLNRHSYNLLAHAACLAFFSDINKMSTQKSFSERDTELLLHLKHIAPLLPRNFVRVRLEYLLIQYFSIRLENNTDAAHIKTDNELSEWVEYLNRQKSITLKPELIEIQTQWKMKMNIMNNSQAEPKDESTTSRFSHDFEQPSFAEMEASVMTLPFLPCADQQAIHQRVASLPPALTNFHVIHRQPSTPINVQQHLQAPSDGASLASLPGEGYPFFSTDLAMPPPQYPKESFDQSALTSRYAELSSWSSQPIKPPPGFSEENALCRGILQIYTRNLMQMGMNQLQSVEDRAIQVPAQNMEHPLNPEAPAFYPTESKHIIKSTR